VLRDLRLRVIKLGFANSYWIKRVCALDDIGAVSSVETCEHDRFKLVGIYPRKHALTSKAAEHAPGRRRG